MNDKDHNSQSTDPEQAPPNSSDETGKQQSATDRVEDSGQPSATAAEPAAEEQAVDPETALAEFKEQALRQLAAQKNELESVQRRARRELKDAQRYAPSMLIGKLLPTMDDLQRSLELLAEGVAPEALREGLELVQRNMMTVFADNGLKPIEAAVGEAFDPYQHEAMAQVPSGEVAPSTVMAVMQSGYMLHDRVLRPARVVVSKAHDEAAEPATEAAPKGAEADHSAETTAEPKNSDNSGEQS